MEDKKKHYCIILAGGSGRRLWPASLKTRPKQFLDFFGTGRSLLRQTYDRFAKFIPKENILISTFKDYKSMVREQLPEVDENNILAEPVQLSTAPAVTWATYHIAVRDGNPDAEVIVTPSDQLIVDEESFIRQMEEGLEFVKENNCFLAIGVKPTSPNQAYGYIQTGVESGENKLYSVKSFSEKPEAEYAKMFMESGEFLWNTGIFAWNTKTMMELLNKTAPSVAEDIETKRNLPTREEELELIAELYPTNMRRSLDLVILEGCSNVCVKECDFGWADLGCWPEMHDLAKQDVDGNAVLHGNKLVMLTGCKGTTVSLPDGKAAVLMGLEDYLVADTDKVLVVCPNTDPSLVRKLANEAQMQLGEDYM